MVKGSRGEGPAVVVIGGGLGGAKTAEALREQGFDGPITLVGAEEHLPYERPPLSKEFFQGTKDQSEFTVHPRSWYEDNSVELRLGTRAVAVDTGARTVALADGTSLGWDALVLATGSDPLVPHLPGADADGVHLFRTVDDARALMAAVTTATRLAVLGGGWIGLEVAASARERGAEVTVVHRSDQPLAGALGPELGAVFADLHRRHGVDLRLGASATAVTTDGGRATGLELAGGERIDADVVLLAVGASPNIELAERAGIETVDGGVVVDAGLRSSAPDVYAVGDIAAWYHPVFERRLRSEHWAAALNHPAVVAANILGGSKEYTLLPYFYTDQYELGMEFHGTNQGYTRVVVRGDVEKLEFIAFWLDADDVVLAGMNVNQWDAGDDIQALVRARRPVDRERLADADVALADMLG